MNRREFAGMISVAGLAAAALGATPKPTTKREGPVKPKRLSIGDTVGLVLPASGVLDADSVAFAREQLEAIGFKVLVGKHALDRHGYFAGRDQDRAADINMMFADDAVAGVVCYTGGWGSPRVLPYLDYELIAKKPKVIIGYSDITALINAIHQRSGIMTFHGPVAASNIEPYSLDNFKRVVMTAEPAGLLAPPPKKPSELVDRVNRIVQISPGKASGRLAGGNLTMISSLIGTPFEIDTKDVILFLEDTHEEPYRIDRMLTQLALAGKLKTIAGFVFGRCTDCDMKGPGFSLQEILQDRFATLGIPAMTGMSFGHIEQKLTMPIGAMATIDSTAGTLTIDEAAVS